MVCERARRDPNIFIEYVLGLRQASLHKEVQAHLTSNPSCYIELPRGHGKTTACAARVAWEIGRDPEIRVKYVQQNDIEAAKTAVMIRGIIESDAYRRVFDVVPMQPWAKSSFRVARTSLFRDPTLEASGIFGHSGGRWDLLVCDDICDLKNTIQQPTLRKQVIEAYSNTWAPMRASDASRCWRFGTPWHTQDITALWRKIHVLLRCPCVDFVSPWPGHFSRRRLEEFEVEHGPVAYARAYELQPLSDADHPVKVEWFKFYEIPAPEGRHFMAVDPAISKAKSAAHSVIIEGIFAPPDLYITNLIRDKFDFPELLDVLRTRISQFKPESIVVENVAFQRAIGEQLLSEWPYPIEQAPPIGDKTLRINWLAPHIRNGKIRLMGADGMPHESQRVLYDELTMFPVAATRDAMDALFYLSNKAFDSPADFSVTFL